MFHELKQSSRCTLPTTCIVYGKNTDSDHSICNECGCTLPKLGDCCRRCGIEISGGRVTDSCCTNCRLSRPGFDSCTCLFPYVSPIDKLVADFKFSDRFDIGYSLSRFLARTFNAYYIGPAKPEQLIPAPLHRNQLDLRGFNQASEIGNVLAKHCGVSISHCTLSRTRNTQPQTSMSSAAARKANLRKGFNVSKSDSLTGVTHIALIDTVVTTMATIQAISRMLRAQQD